MIDLIFIVVLNFWSSSISFFSPLFRCLHWVCPQAKENSSTSSTKKKNKFVNLYHKEGQDRLAVLLPGRNTCECLAQKHKLINNCLSCGRIVCEQEGSGPCLFCGTLVCNSLRVLGFDVSFQSIWIAESSYFLVKYILNRVSSFCKAIFLYSPK